MTLEQRLTALAQAIAADIKAILTSRGSLAALTTTDKSSLVSAINELQSEIESLGSGGAAIDDNAVSNSTTAVYSANKITQLISAAKTEILGGASSAFDTLLELQTALEGDDTAISSLVTAVGNRVAYDAAQSLTDPQKAQACSNIGVGNPDRNFVTDYTTARDV